MHDAMACLIVIEGPATGKHFPLDEHRIVSIGRDDDCTFQIVDPAVSRKHLQVIRQGNGTHVAADYRSANGVVINGQKVTADMPLKDGDRVSIGQSTVLYSAKDYADGRAALTDVRKTGEWQRSTIMR